MLRTWFHGFAERLSGGGWSGNFHRDWSSPRAAGGDLVRRGMARDQARFEARRQSGAWPRCRNSTAKAVVWRTWNACGRICVRPAYDAAESGLHSGGGGNLGLGIGVNTALFSAYMPWR